MIKFKIKSTVQINRRRFIMKSVTKMIEKCNDIIMTTVGVYIMRRQLTCDCLFESSSKRLFRPKLSFKVSSLSDASTSSSSSDWSDSSELSFSVAVKQKFPLKKGTILKLRNDSAPENVSQKQSRSMKQFTYNHHPNQCPFSTILELIYISPLVRLWSYCSQPEKKRRNETEPQEILEPSVLDC